MLVVWHHASGARWLPLERMQLAISQKQRLGRVLVVMGECQVPLRHIEAENAQANCAHELLLEWTLLLVRNLVPAYRVEWLSKSFY